MSHTNKPDFWRMPANDLIDIIGWSKPKFAQKLKIGTRSAQRMCSTNEIPYNVRHWLVTLAETHWFHELPEDWNNE